MGHWNNDAVDGGDGSPPPAEVADGGLEAEDVSSAADVVPVVVDDDGDFEGYAIAPAAAVVPATTTSLSSSSLLEDVSSS